MLETLVKQGVIFYVMGIAFVLAAAAKLISYITVRRMVKAASEIHKSNHKLMKLIKAKFEHACMVSDRVQNVEAFVEKYMYEYKVLGLRSYSWRSLPKRLMWVILLLGALGIFTGYRMEGLGTITFRYLQWTSIFGLVWAVLHFTMDENVRLLAAKNYIVEYLENVCAHRYAKSIQVAEGEAPKEEAEVIERAQVKEEPEQRQKTDQEMRIRAILEEFMA